MSIKKKLAERIEPTVVTVKDGKDEYTFEGMPDAEVYARSLVLTDDQKEKKARHWSRVVGKPIGKDIVPHVLAVRETLRHEDDPTLRYDEVEIAQLAKEHGDLFILKFVPAAYQALGMKADDIAKAEKEELGAVGAVALGNSKEGESSKRS
jgi:hypothetical protein